MLASVWQRNLPLVLERLQTLRSAALYAVAGNLSPSARREASEIAHKLAGSLGMFGNHRGTELAQELEVLLEAEGPVAGPHFYDLAVQLAQTVQR